MDGSTATAYIAVLLGDDNKMMMEFPVMKMAMMMMMIVAAFYSHPVALTEAMRRATTFTLFTNPNVNWQTAVTFCSIRNQELIRVTSQEEQDFLTSLGQSGGLWYNKITGTTWSSLHDPDASSVGTGYQWQLSDLRYCQSLEPSSWTKWYPGEPLNAVTNLCIKLEWDNNAGLRWRSENCQNNLGKVICRDSGGDCNYREYSGKAFNSLPPDRVVQNLPSKDECLRQCSVTTISDKQCYAAEWESKDQSCILHMSDSPISTAAFVVNAAKTLFIPECLLAALQDNQVPIPSQSEYAPCSEYADNSSPASLTSAFAVTTSEAKVSSLTTIAAATLETSQPETVTLQSTVSPELETSTQSEDSAATTQDHTEITSEQPTYIVYSCACCTQINRTQLNATDHERIKNDIVNALSIDQKQTSVVRRKYYSAPDQRLSAQTIGSFGAAVLVFVFGTIIFMDVSRMCCKVEKTVKTNKKRR